MITATQRRHEVTIAKLLNRYAEQVLWAEVRPMSTRFMTLAELMLRLEAGRQITMDCDESCTLIARLASLKDPNGQNYDGEGSTGALLTHLPHFSDWSKVHPGTLIVLGAYPGIHAVMVLSPAGRNPIVYSHGSHARAAIWDLATELTYHPPGILVTLLEIADL